MTSPAEGTRAQPLAGLRVLDLGTRIGAPFAAGLLGEWGAEVIKVEQPVKGDFLRHIGPFVAPEARVAPEGGARSTSAAYETDPAGYSLFWAVEGRGRRSVTCDLHTSEGQDLLRRLASRCDVLVENFRPGTMESWNLGPEDLDSYLVYVRISAFGQDGPYAQRPGLDRLGIAYGGLLHLTGEPDRPPVRPGVTIADYLTGLFAAQAALAALYRRDAVDSHSGSEAGAAASSRQGAVIDASLYGSVLRILEWTLPAYEQLAIVRTREGNRLANSAPLDNYPSSDGRYVCIVAGSDANFARLCRAMGRPDLLDDDRYSSLAKRAEHGQEINAVVESWTRLLPAREIERRCTASGVPVATAYSAVDIMADPHIAARNDIVAVDDPVLGTLSQQAPQPHLVGETRPIPQGAPRLGADNEVIWGEWLGLGTHEIESLRERQII